MAEIGRLNHAYRLVIGSPVPLKASLSSTDSSFTSPVNLDAQVQNSKNKANAYELTTHQIEFKIIKDDSKDPNKCYVTVINMSDDTVNYLASNVKNNLAVIFEAGYEMGDPIKTIFKGTVEKVEDRKVGVDRETRLIFGDGTINITEATTSRSYPKGTPTKNIFTDLVKDLGTSVGQLIVDSSYAYAQGPVAFVGGTAKNIKKFADNINHSFSIQDGAAYIVPNTKRLAKTSAYISPETGLKGSPEPLTQKGKKASTNKNPENGIKFECQLDGSIIPTSTVWVKSSQYDSAFKVTKVEHSGNFEGDDWTTTVECLLVSGVVTK